MFNRVDLPAPFSPITAWNAPGRTCRCTFRLAVTPGNRLVIPSIRMIHSAVGEESAGFGTGRLTGIGHSISDVGAGPGMQAQTSPLRDEYYTIPSTAGPRRRYVTRSVVLRYLVKQANIPNNRASDHVKIVCRLRIE